MHINEKLNEICMYAAMNTAVALSKFVQAPISVDSYQVSDKWPDDWLSDQSMDELAISFYLPVCDGMSGNAVLFYSQHTAFSICDILNKSITNFTNKICDEDLRKLSNVTEVYLNNFVSALSQAFQLKLMVHPVSIYDVCLLEKIVYRINESKEDQAKTKKMFFVKLRIDQNLTYLVVTFDDAQLKSAITKNLISNQ